MRRLWWFTICATLALWLGGCQKPSQSVTDTSYTQDPLLFAHKAAELGFRGEANILWGPANAGPFWWNLTGSQGYVHVTIEPLRAATQPVTP